MPTGPKPTPSRVRELHGNPSRRPLPPHEPRVEAAMPPVPKELDEVARKEWFRCGRLMRKAGMISRLDRAVLATYCAAWSRWLKAETALRTTGLVIKTPNGSAQISPALSIANKAMQQLMTLSAEMGLSPSSRTRIHAMNTDADDDPIADFQRRRPSRPA